jgi:hypothetical protein
MIIVDRCFFLLILHLGSERKKNSYTNEKEREKKHISLSDVIIFIIHSYCKRTSGKNIITLSYCRLFFHPYLCVGCLLSFVMPKGVQ